MAHTHHPTPVEKKGRTALSSAFWFVLILAFLFIAAVNFVKVMGSGHEGHGEAHGAPAHHTMEATSNQTLSGETGTGKPQETTTQHAAPESHADQGAAAH